MLHYVIAVCIADVIDIKDKNRFFIGSLIPDLSSHDDGTYATAHFLSENFQVCEVGEKRFDWEIFKEKYHEKILEDDLYLGYLCHLISDEIWFQMITDKYVRIYPKEERINYIKKGYGDFQKLNALLIDKYQLHNPNLQMVEIDLKEIKQELQEYLLQQFENDFVVYEKFQKKDLLLYPYDTVMEFLDISIASCIKEISNKVCTEKINES